MKKEKKSSTTLESLNIKWPRHASLVLPSTGKSLLHDNVYVAHVIWHAIEKLMFPYTTGKSLLLNDQHVNVAHVVQRAIAKLTEETLLNNAFLDVNKKINYHRRLLIDTAHKLMSEIPPIEDMHDRLKEDMGFCDALGKLVCSTKSFHTILTRIMMCLCRLQIAFQLFVVPSSHML